jgi:anionic cell wall polymer biosynthesis LytR-Cps2A-Psr (LCP) family protein
MKKFIGIIVLIVFAGGLLAGGIYTLSWMKKPLDPPLELDIPAEVSNAIAARQPQAPQNQQKFCGNTGTMAIMVSGLSVPMWRPVHGVGAIRLVKVDFSGQSVRVLNVPRALYVQVPEDYGAEDDQTSITIAYRIARDAATGNNPDVINRKATQDLAQVLVDDFGYLPDKYVTVDPAVFVDLVDRLGGIDIHLLGPIDGTPDDFGEFVPDASGNLHLDGARTLDFLRLIHPANAGTTVWDKFDRQVLVAKALLVAFLGSGTDLPDLVKEARKMVVTDLSVDQILDLLCVAQQVGIPAAFEDVPEDWVTVDSEEKIVVNSANVQDVKDLFQEFSSEKK